MVTEASVRDSLIRAAHARIAQGGVEALSLRAVTADVGKSTMSVFQLFGSKDGLVRASVERALADERAFHAGLLDDLRGLPSGRAIAGDVICAYILRRADLPSARLWLEVLFKSRRFPGTEDLARAWHGLRADFWGTLFAGTECAALVPVLPALTLAEEAYAHALAHRTGYPLLLGEAMRILVGADRGAGRSHGAVRDWVERGADFTPPHALPATPVMARLLEAAVAQLVREGPSGFNAKKAAAEEDIPSSQIVYHFGDFATFRNRAILQALMRGIPDYLDGADEIAPSADATRPWNEELERLVRPAQGDQAAGYYVNYARIVGQAAISGRADSALVPLILHLRAIEGRGIHRASQSWPEPLRLDRGRAAGFAIWIKGQAILNEALGHDPRASDGIAEAAAIFAREPA